ncbi:MAG: OsmC family peroxiredoxin [Chitinivibrionales bacterium]|nr:OsmC family peroxiredoxin [Chitinivibrionales bacterium]
MSKYQIALEWKRDSETFDYKAYTRDHTIRYGEEGSLCASAAPEYHGNKNCLNPEQAFVISMASCHMLTFLALAAKKRFTIDDYSDTAIAVLGKNPEKKPAITRIELSPRVSFSGDRTPSEQDFQNLHDQAHDLCFIANSVASCVEVVIHPEIVSQ